MQYHVDTIAFICKLLGVRHVVVSPGSRSAPLVFAFARHHFFTIHTVADERSAAYQALGIAQQTRKPAVLICTSGTAAANYYPAVAEAYYQGVPLLVLTADRPAALLNQQDGQMIDQRNLYGNHVRAFYQLGELADEHSGLKQTTALVAEAIAKTCWPVKGPVHINIPLAEPLYPEHLGKNDVRMEQNVEQWLRHHLRDTRKPENEPEDNELEYAWINSSSKMIIIGNGPVHETWITPLLQLRESGDAVILADVSSNQHAMSQIANFDKLISAADKTTLSKLEPDLIISMGGPVLSKSLKTWLKQVQPQWHFRVGMESGSINTYGNVTHFLNCRPDDVLSRIAGIRWSEPLSNRYVEYWRKLSDRLYAKTENFMGKKVWSELHATDFLLSKLPQACNLQLANSSVVRYVSLTGKADAGLIINSNRGTSGIDGCTSTAVGAAMVNDRFTVLFTGDLAFLYDRNALWQEKLPDNLRIIVFNNNGGGIFTLIDGPLKHRKFERFFTTPHSQNIKSIAAGSGLDYYFCQSFAGLDKVLDRFFDPLRGAALLELKFDMKKNAEIFSRFKKIKL